MDEQKKPEPSKIILSLDLAMNIFKQREYLSAALDHLKSLGQPFTIMFPDGYSIGSGFMLLPTNLGPEFREKLANLAFRAFADVEVLIETELENLNEQLVNMSIVTTERKLSLPNVDMNNILAMADTEVVKPKYSWAGLEAMDQRDLEYVIKDSNLTIRSHDYITFADGVHQLRRGIARELGIEIPDQPVGPTKSKPKTEPKKERRRVYTWSMIDSLSYEDLEELVEEENLDCDDLNGGYETTHHYRLAIAKELGIPIPKLT